jgi:hypothetical protein
MSQAVADKPQTEAVPPEEELKVLGESTYDRVTSLLMAVVLGAILVVGWLALVYASNQAYASRATSPLQIIEVGGGGGSPDGTSGSTEKVDVAGADAASAASNNEEEAGDFEEPSVEQTPGAMLDTVAEAGQTLAEADLGATMPTGGQVASGKRASKLGKGGPGLGFGPGDGGVAREQRWSIIFSSGQQTIDQYARQLDALGVELAVVASQDQLLYISHCSNPTPTKRHGAARNDHRLYFLWQGRGRKPSDIALFERAGVKIGDENVFQFYSPESERRLAELEVRYKGRSPGEIRITRFQVVPKGDSFDFTVVAQETLR